MDTYQLIDQLSTELKPVRILRPRYLIGLVLLGLIMAVTVVLGVFQVRGDYAEAWKNGALVWKPGLFLLGAVSLYFWLIPASLAGRFGRFWYALPAGLGGLFLLFKLGETLIYASELELWNAVFDARAPYCLGTVSVLGALVFTGIWRGWLRHATPDYGAWAGFLAGLLSGAVAASAYALHCDQDSPVYIVLYYGVPIALLGVLGAIIGRTLRW